MFVGDLLNYQSACPCFPPKSADGHATVREAKLDCVFESQWFVGTDIIICSYRQFRFPLKCRSRLTGTAVFEIKRADSKSTLDFRLLYETQTAGF
jgi:hypothetical protein